MLTKNLPLLNHFPKNEGTLEAQVRYTDIERTIYDIKMDSNNAFEKIDLNDNIIENFSINQPDFELSNNELIFWNVETNKCFIISHTDERPGCWADDRNDNCVQNEEIESRAIEKDLSKNIEEMRKILETNGVAGNDDVEEEMRRMFDENNTFIKDIVEFERIDRSQSKLSDQLYIENRQVEEDFNNFQLEETHYEHIIEIASEQLVESSQKPPTVCGTPDKDTEGCTNSKDVNTMLDNFQVDDVRSIIVDSIDEKRQRLQEIRKRISKIHIHLNKKRKHYESLQNDVASKGNKSIRPELHDISKQDQVPQSAQSTKKKHQKAHRIDDYKKILIRWRKKFEKQVNTNYKKQNKALGLIKLQNEPRYKPILHTKIDSGINKTNSIPSYPNNSNCDEIVKDGPPATAKLSQSGKVFEMDTTNKEVYLENSTPSFPNFPNSEEKTEDEQPVTAKLSQDDHNISEIDYINHLYSAEILEKNYETKNTDNLDAIATQFEIHDVENIENEKQNSENNPEMKENSREKPNPLLSSDFLTGNYRINKISKRSGKTSRSKFKTAQCKQSQARNFTLKKISPVKFEIRHRMFPQHEMEIKSATFLKANKQQSNKIYEHFIENIDEKIYHRTESFNLDIINYTFRWLQFMLSRKLHKSEMETELEKLKVHYYRLFHLNLIRSCGKKGTKDTKIRKHCECWDKLNRTVFCTLMDTYVLRIVKYIILAFHDNFKNIVNPLETLAGFLSFFINRSKLLYLLFLYKNQFLLKEQTAPEETSEPKSMSSLARMCLLKTICKNPKMHDCMGNMGEQKKVKSFKSSHSIENLLQKPVVTPLNLILNREKRYHNLLQPRTKLLLNYRHKFLGESHNAPTKTEMVVNLPENLIANHRPSKSQLVTTRRMTGLPAAGSTSNRFAGILHSSGQKVNQEYVNMDNTLEKKIFTNVQPRNFAHPFYYSNRLQNLKNINNKSLHLAPERHFSNLPIRQIDNSHKSRYQDSRKTSLRKQYTSPSQTSGVESFRRHHSLHQPFPQVLPNPYFLPGITEFNNLRDQMIAGRHNEENHKCYLKSLNYINPKQTDTLNLLRFPLDKNSMRFDSNNDDHQRDDIHEKSIDVLSNVLLKKTISSSQAEPAETILISDSDDSRMQE